MISFLGGWSYPCSSSGIIPVQVGRATWPEKIGSGGPAHGIVLDMLSELRKEMEEWMHRKKLSKQVPQF